MEPDDLVGMKEQSKKTNLEFATLIVLAFVLSYIPLIHVPFTWLMTFFHEISHGLAAALSGGSIVKISLHLTGSGLCYTTGGSRFLILQAGYIGAVACGVLIYEMADEISHRYINIMVLFIASLIVGVALFYARDPITWVILSILLALFIAVSKLHRARWMKLSLKFMGVYILLDAVRAPLYLIDGRDLGDAAGLSNITGIPEIIWVLLWLALGLSGLIYLWKTK